jgi:hypothetical protein
MAKLAELGIMIVILLGLYLAFLVGGWIAAILYASPIILAGAKWLWHVIRR